MLEVNAVCLRLGDRDLLSDVSFTLGQGEQLALLGPSGGGKTTLLRLVMGFLAPTGGSLSWRGRRLSAEGRVLVPTEQRRFGMVFQEAALFPHLNVTDNVAFGLNRLDRADRRARTDEWLARLGLEALRRRPVQGLSGGERQRVALARAFAAQPDLLLLDEPFSNLDRLVRTELLDTLRAVLRETRTTSILVTHDVRDAVDFGSDLLLIADGRVRRRGGIAEVLADPGSDWTRRFLACGLGQTDPG
ncbi:MAG: ATP-binding cassette domain-containing protein [Thiobacillaceae bacterium]|jgi:iron(III) transport system ATP-binding protein|nr:ATP-binding cassette domain-containing protein [Thiobacillaceae bacterium]